MRVSTRGAGAAGRDKRAGELVVEKLVLRQQREAFGEMQSAADVEVAAPGNVRAVIADGRVEAGAEVERQVAGAVKPAVILAAMACARPAGRGGRGKRQVAARVVVGSKLEGVGAGLRWIGTGFASREQTGTGWVRAERVEGG